MVDGAMMTSSVDPPLTPALADKLTFAEGIAPDAKQAVRALHRASGMSVIVAVVEQKDIERLRPWATITHAHLAKLVEIIEVAPGRYWVAVAHTAGELLRDRLKAIHKKHPVDSVRTALRVSDALTALHDAGGAHGRLHPGTVLLAPEVGREPIVLFGEPSSREYWPPDYPIGESACALTDTWATGALLFHMLTGATPPAMGIANPDELIGLGIENALLRSAIAHALNRDKSARAENLQPLRRELARWFVEHVGEEPGPHSVVSKPPPLPPSLSPGAISSASMAAARRNRASSSGPRPLRRYLVLATTAVVFGLLAAWTVAALRKPKPIVVEWQRPALRSQASAATSAAGAINLAEVPVTGNEEKAGADSTSTCIATFLPEGVLSKQANLGGYCAAGDLRHAMKLLRASFATTPGSPGAPKGWNELGWFELAALATLRAGCCTGATKITWPVTSADCPPMADALDALGRAVSSTQKAESEISRFKEAAHCELTKGKPDLSRPTAEPSAAAERTFRDLFHVASSP
jgi:hypothetical protein